MNYAIPFVPSFPLIFNQWLINSLLDSYIKINKRDREGQGRKRGDKLKNERPALESVFPSSGDLDCAFLVQYTPKGQTGQVGTKTAYLKKTRNEH